MPRPKGPFGDAAWPAGMVGQTAYDADPATLPPLTAAIRNAWGLQTANPIPSAFAMAAMFNAIYQLEQRVLVLEGH